MSRLYIQRKSGFQSVYPLSMFYGAWRASIYFRTPAKPHIRIRGRYYRIPGRLMWVFRPFNRYTETQKGERFV